MRAWTGRRSWSGSFRKRGYRQNLTVPKVSGIFTGWGLGKDEPGKEERARNHSPGGKPAAVILDIDEYQEILERLEDREDLQVIAEMRIRYRGKA